MKKKLVIRQKPLLVVRFRGKLVKLLKRGMSGWHGKFTHSGEDIYLFNSEVYEKTIGH